jgi:methylthioribose-1-phosphate isomerase
MIQPTLEFRDGRVTILDQTRLPLETVMLEIATAAEMWEAIRALRVRGAPAIGVAAAFGMWLGVRDLPDDATRETFLMQLEASRAYLATSRPTAVNLFWALERVSAAAHASGAPEARGLKNTVLEAARAIMDLERETSERIGQYGAELLRGAARVLTHCNAGSLATTGLGTALAPIYAAARRGQRIHVYADETRPLLQGARLTAWELNQAGLEVTLITDNMAASVLRDQSIDAVIVGCDRVAANGDFANKIGTYGVALLARAHNVPFYVAAPFSTVDFGTPDGSGIEIEQRDSREVTTLAGTRTAPEGVHVHNPAFDVTPAHLVTAFITDRGVIRAPFTAGLERLRNAVPDLAVQP